jgi:sulfur carrier protein ThiS
MKSIGCGIMDLEDTMIEVQLRLYASLRRHRPEVPLDGGEQLLLPPGSTVEELIAGLGIPAGEVQTVFVNRRVMHREAVLQAGDRIDLFPAIAGG